MNLCELAKNLGIDTYPEDFEGIYNRLNGNNTAFFNKEEFDVFEREYGILGEYYPLVIEGAEQIKKDKELSLWLSVITEYYKIATKSEIDAVKMPDRKTAGPDVLHIFPFLARINKTVEAYESHGFSKEEISNTLGVFKRMFVLTEMATGKPGYSSKYYNWSKLYSYCEIFDCGSFNFQFKKMPFHAMLLKNKLTEEFSVIMTVGKFNEEGLIFEEGFDSEEGSFTAEFSETDEEYVGHEAIGGYVCRELEKFKKSEWECVVKRLDEAISLHIPRDADLSPDAIDKSIDNGIKIIKERFPEYKPKLIFCSSWLLDPELGELLDDGSKILGFANRFMRFPYAPRRGKKGGFDFVFPSGREDNLEALPENTSLQRKLKQHYISGKSTVFVPGFMTDIIICY